MYDASTAGTTTPPFPFSLIVGWSLSMTLAVIVVMTGSMLFPDNPGLRPMGAVVAGLAVVAYSTHLRLRSFDAMLGIVVAAGLGWGMVEVAATVRGDHEIHLNQYAWVARTLRERPELTPLMATARADRVVTNDELARFEVDVDAFDRSKVLGD